MVTIPSWDEAETIVAAHTRAWEDNMLGEEERPTEEEDADENSLSSLKERLKRAIYFLSEEAWGGEESLNYSLEHELEVFGEESENLLNSMSPTDARQWLAENIEALEALRATTPEERHYTLRKLVAIRGGLVYTAEHLAEWGADHANAPTPTTPTEEDEEIPWDDEDDDDGEEGFHAAATREIVQAYRQTAMCIRENLIARFREAAARLGLQAAEHSPDPWRRGLNGDIGHFMGRVEVFCRGICPIDAQAWLESNIEEFESLHAGNPREYDRTAQVLAVLSDRLFGLLYEIAREK